MWWISNVFTMVVYGMVIFPKVLDHVEATVVDLVEQVNSQANHVPTIVAETICSLKFCRSKGKR